MKNKKLIIVIILFITMTFVSCFTEIPDCKPHMELTTLELQLMSGNVVTKTFEVPRGTWFYIYTFRGSYSLNCNYGGCKYNGRTKNEVMPGVIYFEKIK